jgi:GTP 3',8-cyclase
MDRAIPLAILPPEAMTTRAGAGSRTVRGRTASLGRVLIDSHGRTIRDLRLSITDRCNLRCIYCMEPDVRFARADSLLTVPELLRAARACVRLGVEHIRVTGGEPTVHPELVSVIRGVASIEGVTEVAMTTNGCLATVDAMRAWKEAGLRRLTFSLDSVSESTFAAISRSASPGNSAAKVIAGIEGAIALGLGPVKVNAVVIRGVNEDEIPKLARLARSIGFEMRFIEFMPLDSGHHWDPSKLVSASEILTRVSEAGDLVPHGRDVASSTSETFTFRDAPDVRIGVIAPVTRSFCGACSRLRLTADGKIRPCLFSLDEFDLRDALRDPGSSERLIEDILLDAVWRKQKGHGISAPDFRQPDRPMSAIGG